MTAPTPTRRAAVDWARHAALPFWTLRGWDDKQGGFYERLDASGVPDVAAPRRMRVQARQIYVFAHAAILGWSSEARGLAQNGFEWWLSHCRPSGGGPGFIHVVAPDGTPIDSRIDAYDQAFGLMALAWMFQLTHDAQIRSLIDAELSYLDEVFTCNGIGGWRESIPDALPRRQNPHMHAFEAMLCLYEATDDARFLKRAEGFLLLLRERFVDQSSGVLREYFNADLQPLTDPKWDVAEPGHQFEWTWILLSYARLAKIEPDSIAIQLYDWSMRLGLDRDGFAVDELYGDGRQRKMSRRLWPQTELIKANLALQEAGLDVEAAARADAGLDRLMKAYFTQDPRGGWVDSYDDQGRLADGRMWASSFYHIFRAVTEADRVV